MDSYEKNLSDNYIIIIKNLINALVLAIICTSLFTYCKNANLSDIVIEIEDPEITLDVKTDYKSLLLSFSKDSIPNYEDSGINFIFIKTKLLVHEQLTAIILNFSLSYYRKLLHMKILRPR